MIKAKFQIAKFKSLKQIFCRFEGQYDLECHGQSHKFLNYFKTFRLINIQLKSEGKIHYGSKVVALTRKCTKFLSFTANLTLKVKVNVTSFQTYLNYLDDQ